MITSIGQSNNVQRFSAVNALRGGNKAFEASKKSEELQEEAQVATTAPKGLLDRIDVSDVRKCAEYVGEYNITDEDIKYGMIYGRSVIAEYLA